MNENDIVGMYGIQLGETRYMQDYSNKWLNSQIDTYQLALHIAAVKAMQDNKIS